MSIYQGHPFVGSNSRFVKGTTNSQRQHKVAHTVHNEPHPILSLMAALGSEMRITRVTTKLHSRGSHQTRHKASLKDTMVRVHSPVGCQARHWDATPEEMYLESVSAPRQRVLYMYLAIIVPIVNEYPWPRWQTACFVTGVPNHSWDP
jgi:hypothetical protein